MLDLYRFSQSQVTDSLCECNEKHISAGYDQRNVCEEKKEDKN